MEKVCNLGIVLDKNMTMVQQINKVKSKCYRVMCRIKGIRPYLTESATKILVHSLIISHLDYGHSIYYSLPGVQLRKLRVQNFAVRLVKNLGRYDGISDHKKEMHWLRVAYRIKFKIAVLTFKALVYGKPAYIRDMLTIYEPSRTLRSSGSNLLKIPFVRSRMARR